MVSSSHVISDIPHTHPLHTLAWSLQWAASGALLHSGCTGTICITKDCQVISTPVSGTYSAPSAPALVSGEPPISHICSPLSHCNCLWHRVLFPHLKYISPDILLLPPMGSTLPSSRATFELAAIGFAGHGGSFLQPLIEASPAVSPCCQNLATVLAWVT